jgi:PAS domain S-box-containing protein
MTENERLQRESAALRDENERLARRLSEAEQAADALAGGEVDAVTLRESKAPILLHAAQEQLRRSEKLLRGIFDGSLDALLLSDDSGHWVDANPAACALFGMDRATLTGRPIMERAAPEFDTRAAARELREQGHARGRFPLLGLDGTRRTLDFTSVANVVPGLHLSVLRDVTDNVAAEETLRRSEALFRAVIEGSSEVVSLTAADGATRYLTPARSASTDSGEGIFPEDRAAIAAVLERLAQTGEKELHAELRGRHPDGSTLWWELSATNLLDAPDVGAIVATKRNITARKRAEEALRESERRYRRLIEDLPEPVLVQVDDRIVYANAASAHALGFATQEELRGRSISELGHPVDPSTFTPATVGKEDGEFTERSFRRPNDGRALQAEIKSIPILYDGVPATLSIAHDITRRVEAERAVAQSLLDADLERRKLEAVLEALPVGVWIANAEGALTQTNPAARGIWGGQAPLSANTAEYAVYEARFEATGKSLQPEDWALARTLKTGETIIAESLEIERFDGAVGHVLLSTAPILDERGLIDGGVVVLLDVTESHRATRERERLTVSLEHERGRLGTLLERAPAFIAVLRGEEHVFELANEAYRQLVGRRELLGRRAVDALSDLESQGLRERLDHVFRTGKPQFFTGLPVAFVHHPGSAPDRRYVDMMYQPLVEVDGTTSGIFLHGIDVTEATLAQQRLRAQFHGVPVPIYVWQRVERGDAKVLVLVDYNEAAMNVTKGGIRDHLGEQAGSFHLDDPAIVEELNRCLDTGVTIQREMDHVIRTTGEKKRLFVTYASSPPDLVIVHTEDVTERTKLEHQFRQAQKMEAVGRLAGGVAHDFNNLLSVILSYSDLALRQLRQQDPLYEGLKQIDEAGKRAAGLTRQLLAFSRQQVLQPRVLDLSLVLTEMRSMLGRLLGEDVELVLRVAPALGRVLADPGQIEQVVMNLAVNARDAMPDGGTLTIELTNVTLAAGADGLANPAGDYVLLATRDTGVGMDAETRARIFEPFFTTKQQGKGTGLGLSTVFGIVEQSRGHVAVSSAPGAGSTFRVYLPRTDLAIAEERLGSLGPILRGTETILVVEDEDQLRTVACVVLRGNGYRVLEASNGGEALVISRDFAEKIDLLLTDVVMPRMSGQRLAEHLKAERPDMKTLFTSGYTDDSMLHHGVREQDVAFLHKPFTPQILLNKVRDVLEAGEVARV